MLRFLLIYLKVFITKYLNEYEIKPVTQLETWHVNHEQFKRMTDIGDMA